MRRAGIVLLGLLTSVFSASLGYSEPTTSSGFCKPGNPCWPRLSEWKELGSRLVGKLEIPTSPVEPCRHDALGSECNAAIDNLRNPFFIEDQPGATESSGWLGAWSAATSAYAVVARSSSDIIAAVNFARLHRIHLVVKGTGHDYLGRSNAPDALVVWTHELRKVHVNRFFVPNGCPPNTPKVQAVTVEAGTRWLEAYQEVTVKHGRYVQGGGCTSVGAAGGFLQGGGFGSWSKKYGTAAANLLEAEVVTAGGRLLTVNNCQNQDLFWALRGGGGGTFGIVTTATFRTHELPNYFGWVHGKITARTDDAFKRVLERFVIFYGQNLNNEHWGEQVKINGDNSIDLSLAFLGMTAKEAETVWQPFRDWVEHRKNNLTMEERFLAIPGRKMWDLDFFKKNFPSAIRVDNRPGQKGDLYWWTGDGEQASIYWYTYQSRWLPIDLFSKSKGKVLAQALFDASRHWSVSLHFNKGQAGASKTAAALGRETSMNPRVFNAAALLIAGAGGSGFQGINGREPNAAEGAVQKEKVSAAIGFIRAVTPQAGTYVNEADYFEPDWQQEFWGEHYQRLLEIKKKYDPSGLFTCHHCVGS